MRFKATLISVTEEKVELPEFGDESKIFVGDEGIPAPSKRSPNASESFGSSCADINCVEGFAGWDLKCRCNVRRVCPRRMTVFQSERFNPLRLANCMINWW